MHQATHEGILRERVLAMVRKIRRRWRTRIAIQGMAIVLGAGLLAFLLSVYGLEVSRFSVPSVVAFRVILWVVGAGLTARFLVWPLARRVSDEQAALYLEENEPSMEASVLAALETASGSRYASEALERRLVESALESRRRQGGRNAVDGLHRLALPGTLGDRIAQRLEQQEDQRHRVLAGRILLARRRPIGKRGGAQCLAVGARKPHQRREIAERRRRADIEPGMAAQELGPLFAALALFGCEAPPEAELAAFGGFGGGPGTERERFE